MPGRLFGLTIFTRKTDRVAVEARDRTLDHLALRNMMDFEYPPESPFSKAAADHEDLTQS